jgi:predicted CXXCH cytochrome family protein
VFAPRASLVPLFALVVAAFALGDLGQPRAQADEASDGPSLAPIEGAKMEHLPFEMEECSSCHAAGEGERPGPVKDKTDKLCFECHDGVEKELSGAEVEHAGYVAACVDCHNPHNANQPALLHAPSRSQCLSCHEDTADALKAVKVEHGAMAGDMACITCHSPHASANAALLRADVKTVCLVCHSQPGFADHHGKPLQVIGDLLARPVQHKPINEQGCAECHDAHGSEHRRILRAPYTDSFYARWSKDNFGLCLKCHDAALVDAKTTRTATGFRDGDRNLHALHVDRGERGRSCRACHETHASNKPKLVADDVAFGSHGWRLELNFEQTATGGSCAKTCHTFRSYDRNR